ncbi:hypothetical protein [Sphingomonas sp.]|uniref:hypothetical protein n=1 Tax=Sphingomonas sp. TaxID=28214 RepID=UPI002DD661AD|nr:hypothetical protein [Sphingomonas sp.]
MTLRRRVATSGFAVTASLAIITPSDAQTAVGDAGAAQQVSPPTGAPAGPTRRNINPYDRDVTITAPLQFNQRVLGELPVLLTRDDRFIVTSNAFQELIAPLLTPDAREELKTIIGDKERFEPEEISAAGVRLDYDPEQLAVLILKIAPEKRSVEILYRPNSAEQPGDAPLPFSAYLNINTILARNSRDGEGLRRPDLFLNGAIRYNNLVLEADFQTRRDFIDDSYGIDRRYARFVYDQPQDARRWFLGDLDPETRGRQGFVNMGGIGVSRQRQRFDAFRSNVLAAGRRLVLQEQSTVRVSRNGLFQREFALDAGQYDISNLPLDTGSNDIDIEVQGVSGTRQSFAYQAYLDTIDLEAGDHEYGAYLGVLDEGGFGNPDYSRGIPVFTGFWRKAFLNRPAIGVGAQLSEDVQNVTAQTQFILPNSARLRFDLGASKANEGVGFAATAGYDQIVGGASGYDTLTFVVDFTSANYTTIGLVEVANPISWNLTGTYTKRFTPNLFATTTASYRVSRSALQDDAYSVSAIANYRFSREWSVQAGFEYLKTGFRDGFGRTDGIGLTVGLVWQPRYNRRGELRYNSLRNLGSARFQETVDNRAGSFGYSVTATTSDTAKSVGGQLDYVANRFDANFTHTRIGSDFDGLGRDSITTLRVGTSLAYAGGKLAVGRTINDSFALVSPHPTLKGRDVIVGDSLENGRYVSKSGVFGPAMQNLLNSYLNQTVRYDVVDAPLGYDIGDGAKRVRPAYKSGYMIEVGSAAFVSAIGTLHGRDGKPVALISGVLRRSDQNDAEPEPFFTNSVGRFAIARLEPGVTYRVTYTADGPMSFTFTVPPDNNGLLDLGVVGVEPRKEP